MQPYALADKSWEPGYEVFIDGKWRNRKNIKEDQCVREKYFPLTKDLFEEAPDGITTITVNDAGNLRYGRSGEAGEGYFNRPGDTITKVRNAYLKKGKEVYLQKEEAYIVNIQYAEYKEIKHDFKIGDIVLIDHVSETPPCKDAPPSITGERQVKMVDEDTFNVYRFWECTKITHCPDCGEEL